MKVGRLNLYSGLGGLFTVVCVDLEILWVYVI